METASRIALVLIAVTIAVGCQSAPRPHCGIEGAAPEIGLRELRPGAGVWVHTSYHTFPDGARYASNGLVVREGDGLLLVDTAWGERPTIELLRRIDQVIGLPVRRAVVTHSHADRIGGVDVLEARGVEVFAHPMTRRLAIEAGSPVPDRVLEGLASPGDATAMGPVEVLYPGPAHSPDNLMVWVPDARVLLGGCAMRGMTWGLGNVEDADLDHWPAAIRIAQRRYRDAQVVVPGHGEIGGPELLTHTLDLLER